MALDFLGQVWLLIPVVILMPLYFSHQIEYGVIAQATHSAGMVLASFLTLTNFSPADVEDGPECYAARRDSRENSRKWASARQSTAGAPRISFAKGKTIALDNGVAADPRRRTAPGQGSLR